MPCPKCQSKTCVKDARYNEKEGWTYRRRVCKECQHLFTTRETLVEGNYVGCGSWWPKKEGDAPKPKRKRKPPPPKPKKDTRGMVDISQLRYSVKLKLKERMKDERI